MRRYRHRAPPDSCSTCKMCLVCPTPGLARRGRCRRWAHIISTVSARSTRSVDQATRGRFRMSSDSRSMSRRHSPLGRNRHRTLPQAPMVCSRFEAHPARMLGSSSLKTPTSPPAIGRSSVPTPTPLSCNGDGVPANAISIRRRANSASTSGLIHRPRCPVRSRL